GTPPPPEHRSRPEACLRAGAPPARDWRVPGRSSLGARRAPWERGRRPSWRGGAGGGGGGWAAPHRAAGGVSFRTRGLVRAHRLAREELPAAALLEPDLKDIDPDTGGLAVELALGRPRVTGHRVGAHDGDRVIGQGEGLEGRLSRHDP